MSAVLPTLTDQPASDAAHHIDVELPINVAQRLRMSLTDFCNFQCFFCHNEGQAARSPNAPPPLTVADYHRIGRAARDCGITYIKLTGGEPLLYRDPAGGDIGDVVEALRDAYAGTALDLSITTNGERLPRWLDRLRSAGLDRATISVATLNPVTFRRLINRRGGDPRAVLSAIEAAREAKLTPIKVNTVLFGAGPSGPGNLDELPDIIAECRKRGVAELRLYPMLYAPGIPEFDDRYQYWDQRIIDLILSAAWASDVDYQPLLTVLRGVVNGEYDEEAKRKRFTLSFPIGGVRIAMNVMPLDRSQLTCSCGEGARCQEGPYALRLSASGQLRGCLNGPVLGDVSKIGSDVDTRHEFEHVKEQFISAHADGEYR